MAKDFQLIHLTVDEERLNKGDGALLGQIPKPRFQSAATLLVGVEL